MICIEKVDLELVVLILVASEAEVLSLIFEVSEICEICSEECSEVVSEVEEGPGERLKVKIWKSRLRFRLRSPILE